MVSGRSASRWLTKDPPTDAGCRAERHQPCYSPQEMRNAYDIAPLIKKGIIGTGQTIVIIDSFGSPDPLKDLKQFDADYGLPDPPSFKVFSPLGTVPLDKKNDDQMGWAQETNLDIQWAHVMAPGASIVLLTSPVSETQGMQGIPEFYKLEKYAIDNHLGKISHKVGGRLKRRYLCQMAKK